MCILNTVLSDDTAVNVEIIAWLRAEDAKNVVDGIDRHTSWLEFHRISTSEEAVPRWVQPQFLVEFCMLLGFSVCIIAHLVVFIHFFLRTQPTSVRRSVSQFASRDKIAGCIYFNVDVNRKFTERVIATPRMRYNIYLFKIRAKGQNWPLTCNTNHKTMFDMQEISIKTNSNMHKPN